MMKSVQAPGPHGGASFANLLLVIDVDQVRVAMAQVEGVLEVHDLHVWTITSGMESLSAHVVVEDARYGCDVLGEIRGALHERFGLHHVTLQIETRAFEEPSARLC